MNDVLTVFLALAAGIGLAGLLFVVRSPSELWSLIRNPREHLFGNHTYAGGDKNGLLWDVDDEEYRPAIPAGFTRYTEPNPFGENTYLVIVNSDDEVLWGMTSDDIWPRRNYRYVRDEVIAYRVMTEEEIVEHETSVAEFLEKESSQ